MIDSTNPRILADNIRHLKGESGSQASDISTLQTTVTAQGNAIGALQIYDDAETDTGMKWIDGKNIYRKVFTGTSPVEGNLDFPLNYDTIVELYGFYVTSAGATNYITRSANLFGNQGTNIRLSAASAASYQGVDCYIIVDYTKPDPSALNSPAPDDTRFIEPEPEVRESEEPVIDEPIEEPVKKTTRKKTTTTE